MPARLARRRRDTRPFIYIDISEAARPQSWYPTAACHHCCGVPHQTTASTGQAALLAMPPHGRHPSPPTCRHTPAQYQVRKHCKPIRSHPSHVHMPSRAALAITLQLARPTNTHTAASSLRRVRSFGQAVRQRLSAYAQPRPCATPPARPCPHQSHSRPGSMVLTPAHNCQLFPSRLSGCLQNCAHTPPPRAYLLALQSLLPRPCASTQQTPKLRQEAVMPPAAPPPGRATPGQKQSATAKHRGRRVTVHAFNAPLAGAAIGGAACSHGVQPAGMCSSRPGQVEAGSECQNRRLEQASKVQSCRAPEKQAGLQS